MNRNLFRLIVLGAAAAALSACAASQPKTDLKASAGVASPQAMGEQMVWSSSKERPAWTMSEPDSEGGYMYFVGVSGDLATEQLARNDALRDATQKVVSYLGTMAKDKFERARTSFGLASSTVDPTEASRQFEKQLAANVAKNLKAKEWYEERWQRKDGTSWKAFVLARMPTQVVNEAAKRTAEENLQKAQEEAKRAATEQAKKQAEDAAAFWKQMKEQGLVE